MKQKTANTHPHNYTNNETQSNPPSHSQTTSLQEKDIHVKQAESTNMEMHRQVHSHICIYTSMHKPLSLQFSAPDEEVPIMKGRILRRISSQSLCMQILNLFEISVLSSKNLICLPLLAFVPRTRSVQVSQL